MHYKLPKQLVNIYIKFKFIAERAGRIDKGDNSLVRRFLKINVK